MTFVSWAQNFEDVMIRRALRQVEKGFYIDVGAQDPETDSVTKAFYDLGWTGINVEPEAHWFEMLEEQRPRDINMQVAVSDSEGELRFYNVRDTGLSTTNAEYARRHVEAGFAIDEKTVPCTTLDVICREAKVDVVHFLKVDCEGAEESVLRGISLDDVRPWIILVEATEPCSDKPAYESWEPLLVGRRYHFVYDDGLNRFYVADEMCQLNDAFSRPPNVFDDYQRASERAWREAAESLRGENDRRESALVEHRKLLEDTEQRIRVERGVWGQTIEFLRNENERREEALAEHRRQLEAVGNGESAERARLLETIEFLRNENERREEALAEHRRQLEAAGNAESAERAQLLETIEFLQGEHRKKEGQLTEANGLLADMHASLANVEARAKLANESYEKDRSELQLALLTVREQFLAATKDFEHNRSVLSQTILELRDEARARSKETEELQAYSSQLSHQLSVLGQDLAGHRAGLDAGRSSLANCLAEIESLRAKVRDGEAKILQMDQWIRELRTSTSWRITTPLRWLKRGMSRMARRSWHLACKLARKPVHWLRPVMRRIIQWNWLRGFVVALVGKDSSFTCHARLFLFGAPGTGAQDIVQNTNVDSLSSQARRIMSHIDRVHVVRGLPMIRGDRKLINGMAKQTLRIYTNIQMLRVKWRLGRKQ